MMKVNIWVSHGGDRLHSVDGGLNSPCYSDKLTLYVLLTNGICLRGVIEGLIK